MNIYCQAYNKKYFLVFQYDIWRRLEEDPLFQHTVVTPTVDEQRRLATARMYRIKKWNLISFESIAEDVKIVSNLLIVKFVN